MTPSSEALVSPSSLETCLRSDRSDLFPTSMITTSLPRSERTSSIHFDELRNEARSVISYTTTATDESLM
eukprot:CAMPEP_0181264100 /NCGR_PEP_ID=MMETSP1097-20121128/2953_1 /TAXON_ID=35684 /ORGANISM="Pseudopedinella elastica, Strain CCMP716" /LENGTH=69 /DNA_ID=CAMNT_0023362971 /DNA_START=399 /DNA_END=608 /DNA_ORIENTATION=-